MNYEARLPNELPRGFAFPTDPANPDRVEMAVWGRHLDVVEIENRELLNALASPRFAAEWGLETWERVYGILPPSTATLDERRAAILRTMKKQKSPSVPTLQAMCALFLGYTPTIKTSPHAFYPGRSRFAQAHSLVEPYLLFGFWIELDAAQTAKPYDDIPLITALYDVAAGDAMFIWTYWSDEDFDWRDYYAWADRRFRIREIAGRILGYYPYVKMPPNPFHFGSTFDSGRPLVETYIRHSFWIELDATQTSKPYDDTDLINAVMAAMPADVQHVWTYWSDEQFDYSDYQP